MTFKETKTIFKEIVDAYTDYFLNPNNVFPAGLEIDTEKSFITFNQTGINASIVFKSLKIDTEWHKIIVKGKNDSLEIIIDGWTSVDVGDSQPETPVFTVEENPAVKPEDNSNVVDDNTVLETANNVFSLMTGIMMNTEISQEDYQSGYIAVGTQNYNSGELPLTVVYTEQQLTYVNRFVKDIFGSGSLNSFLIHQIIPINDNNGEVKMIAKLNFAGLSFNSVEFEFIALPMEYSNDGQGSSKTDNSMDGWFESFTIDGESYKYLVDSFFKSLLKMSYAQMMISPFDAINRKDPSSDISQSDITISGNDYIFEGNALPAKGTITINKENGTFSFEDFNYYMSYTYDGSYKDVISSLISGSGTVVYNESDKISSVAFDTFSVDKIGEATDYELRNANIIIDFTFKRMSMGSY